MSLSSVVAAIGLPLLMLISGGSSAYVVVSLVASLMVLWRHRSNIERLLAGRTQIGQKFEHCRRQRSANELCTTGGKCRTGIFSLGDRPADHQLTAPAAIASAGPITRA